MRKKSKASSVQPRKAANHMFLFAGPALECCNAHGPSSQDAEYRPAQATPPAKPHSRAFGALRKPSNAHRRSAAARWSWDGFPRRGAAGRRQCGRPRSAPPRSISRSIDAVMVDCRRGEHAPGELAGRFAGREPLRRGDRAALVEKRSRQVDRAGGDDVAESGPHQAGDAGGGGDEHPLFPHLLQDRVAQARLEARARQCRRDGLLRGDTVPSCSPNAMRWMSLRWRMSPSGPSVAEITHSPPSTLAAAETGRRGHPNGPCR